MKTTKQTRKILWIAADAYCQEAFDPRLREHMRDTAEAMQKGNLEPSPFTVKRII